MVADIAKRLRRRGDRLSVEAADAIEQLRAKARELREEISWRFRTRARREKGRDAEGITHRRFKQAWGGHNPESERQQQLAKARAEQLRELLTGELAGLSARAVARMLNRTKIKTPRGRKWHSVTVLRVMRRLEPRP